MKLALGTAQFGLPYGIGKDRKAIPKEEGKEILKRAYELGIRLIDTAPVYGQIEEHLQDMTAEVNFEFVSKIPDLALDFGIDQIRKRVSHVIQQIRNRLGARISTILFHSSSNLMGENADEVWQIATEALLGTNIRLGVSCYSPEEVIALCQRYPISVVQVPGNVFDQRLHDMPDPQNVEIHLRSAFLQGALVRQQSEVGWHIPQIIPHLKKWAIWCENRGLSKLQAALGIVKGFKNIKYCVVGVDSIEHLELLNDAWHSAPPLFVPELALQDLSIIDPRLWK